MFGDTDGDGDADCSDLSLASVLVFDGSVVVGDTDYNVRLDSNMNHIIDGDDQRRLVAMLLPGDLLTGFSDANDDDLIFFESEFNPDFQIDVFEARLYLKLMTDRYGSTPSLDLTAGGIDVVGTGWRVGDAYTPPDSEYTDADILYTLHSWLGSCDGSLQMDGLLAYGFMDFDGDGRVNIFDVRAYEAWIENNTGGAYMQEWDFTENGVNDANDIEAYLTIVKAGSLFGHGILADYNVDASPSCDCGDPMVRSSILNCEDEAANACSPPFATVLLEAECQDLLDMKNVDTNDWLEILFGGDSFLAPVYDGYIPHDQYVAGDYLVQLDWDLDGDNDMFDRYEVLTEIRPADFNADGEFNFFDVSAFLNAYTEMDPRADLNGDGNINFFDVSLFTGFQMEDKPCP